MRVLSFLASSGPFWTKLRILNSVGSECYPYKVEVTGSIPVESTKHNNLASGSAWSGRRTVTAFNQVGSNPIGAAKLLEVEILVRINPLRCNVRVMHGTCIKTLQNI